MKHTATVLVSSLLVTGVLTGVRQLGKLQSLEAVSFDQMVRLQPDKKPDPRLLVVGITESDIENSPIWPITDETLAQTLAQLQKDQPKVIGLDLFRNMPQPPGDQALQRQLQANNLIAITQINTVPPPPKIPEQRIGFNDLVVDMDNVLRRNLMYVELGEEKLYSFSLRLSLRYLAEKNLEVQTNSNFLQIGQTKLIPLEANSGGYQMSANEASGWQILLNYRGERIAREVSLAQVLKGEVDPSWIKDKIVLIGTTAPSIKDLIPTPYSAAKTNNYLMPGVMIHAQMVSQILDILSNNQRQFWFWSQWGEVIWLWSWCLVGGILVWRVHHPWKLGLGVAIAVSGLWGICLITFWQMGWIPFVPAVLGLLFTGSTVLAYKVLHTRSHDLLTGLPNRGLFIRKLKKYQKFKGSIIAVLFLDLDRFKIINDTFGHKIGDQLLLSATSRIQACLTKQQPLARVGGDEFAILLPTIQNISDATAISDQLQQQLMRPFQLNEQDIYTTVSIGIAFDDTGENFRAEDLFRDAHTAMYQAKVLGKARHQIFAVGMHTSSVDRLHLENDLRQAIKNKEFQLYYQPIVNLLTGKIAGFESLVRWISPTRGFVSPGDFIPLAEETGLIIPLGEWILAEACRQIEIWHQQFPKNTPLIMSINLSSRQFTDPDLIYKIKEILSKVSLNNETIKLEITESMVMDEVDKAIEILDELKALGVRLSMDDFGTGYSSLSYLHRFPINTLKVDQSFVRQMEESKEDAEIVKTIIVLGHNLGLDVVAEGIETKIQMQTLQVLKCEYGQGYFFSKPLPRDGATDLLTKQVQW